MYISETVQDRRKLVLTQYSVYTLVLITNRNSHMSFRLVPESVTLNDLEGCNGPYFALFHRIRVQYRLNTIIRPISVSKSTFDSLWPY